MLKLFLFDAAANLAVFGLIWYWLGLPVARTSQLAATAGLALLLAVLIAYLFAVAFTREIKGALVQIPRYLLWLSVLAFFALATLYLRAQFADFAFWLGSWFTFQLRTPVAAESVGKLLDGLLAVLAALVFFCWLLPIAARPVTQWRARPTFSPKYLALVAVYVLLGLYLPWRLFFWTPEITSYAAQLISAGLRWSLAFAIYVAAWLEFARRARATLSPQP